jgi:type III secretory pathway lipoprotein EscJ
MVLVRTFPPEIASARDLASSSIPLLQYAKIMVFQSKMLRRGMASNTSLASLRRPRRASSWTRSLCALNTRQTRLAGSGAAVAAAAAAAVRWRRRSR